MGLFSVITGVAQPAPATGGIFGTIRAAIDRARAEQDLAAAQAQAQAALTRLFSALTNMAVVNNAPVFQRLSAPGMQGAISAAAASLPVSGPGSDVAGMQRAVSVAAGLPMVSTTGMLAAMLLAARLGLPVK